MAHAEPQAPQKRPRIALVLGGGGARGFAHIGVLEWLEKHRIPVDLVVGTSMGGLIGGGYAAGLSVREIKEFVSDCNFDEILTTEIPYKAASMRRKGDLREYLIRPTLGFKKGVQLPSALISDYQITLAIDRFTFAYSNMESFDDLPIPFRCVAVDLESGEQEILADGDLATALRATMAVPGIFKPVTRKGRLLVDGGLVNNLPTDVAKQLGADVVIAVNVAGGLDDRSTLNSLVWIVNQAITIMVQHNTKKNFQFADVLLTPSLEASSSDFSVGCGIAKNGYEAAEEAADALKKYSLDPEQWQEYIVWRNARKRQVPPHPAFIEVEGVDEASRKAIQKGLEPFLNGKKPFNLENLERQLSYVVGTGRYEEIDYKLHQKGDATGILVNPVERSRSLPALMFGIPLYATSRGDISLSAAGRLIAYDWGMKGSETRIDLGVGSESVVGVEHLIPLTTDRRVFGGATTYLHQDRYNFSFDGCCWPWLRNRYFVTTWGIGTNLVYDPSADQELRLGYEWKNIYASCIAKKVFPNLCSGSVNSLTASYIKDNLDNGSFPTKGIRMDVEGKLYLSKPGFAENCSGRTPFKVFGELTYASPVSKNSHILSHLGAGTTWCSYLPLTEQFALGGPFRLSNFRTDELRGLSYFYGTLGYLYGLSSMDALFGKKLYLGVWYEIGGVGRGFQDIRCHQDFLAGFACDSFLGPIFLGASINEQRDVTFHIGIGLRF